MSNLTAHAPLETAPRRSWPMRILGWLWGMTRFLILTMIFFALLVGASYWVVSRAIRGHELNAPNITGRSIAEAMATLQNDRISLLLDRHEPHDWIPEGDIIRQFPQPGARIKSGTPIRVVVSKGAPRVTVPDLRGQSRIAAGIRLRNLGLDVGAVAEVPRSGQAGGTVMATDPPGGSGVIDGSRINLLISSGRPTAAAQRTMPDLYGLTPAEAREVLAQSGLIIAEERKSPAEGVLAGRIHTQSPPAGQSVSSGTPISVVFAPEAADMLDPIDINFRERL